MKKFFVCLFIIAIFGCFVFIIGWTQIKVKPDTFGIVVSKLHGIDSEIAQNGKFTFHKDFLLPSNAKLIQFKKKPFFIEKTVSGSLPSAEIYAGKSLYDFSYGFTFDIEAHVEPEDVRNLMIKNLISDQENLEKYMETNLQAVAQETAAYYLSRASEEPLFMPESVTIVDIYKKCRFYEKYPDFQIDVIALKDSKIPDYELYRNIRNRTLPETDIINETQASGSDYESDAENYTGEELL
ncbi:MAG: hypothetical protein MJ185_03595 [Treponema sp.]|nr:hypothetical protein [Treponema sp.]